MRFVVKTLHNKFSNTKIIPALGNHDTFPPDTFVDTHLNSSKTNDTLKNFYSNFISKGAMGDLFKTLGDIRIKKSFEENCGFYVVRDEKMYENLKRKEKAIVQKFIILNTNLYYSNKAVSPSKDPCDQLQLLRYHLENSTDNENIFIVGHVPPGFFELRPSDPFFDNENITNEMLKIVTKPSYAKKIVAHFYGHTHTSSYRLFMDPIRQTEPRGIAFIAPSITPKVTINHLKYQYSKINIIIC